MGLRTQCEKNGLSLNLIPATKLTASTPQAVFGMWDDFDMIPMTAVTPQNSALG